MTPGLTPRKSTDFLAIHCSASLPDLKTNAAVIDRWHRQRGFLMIGYHYVIKTNGEVEKGRDEDAAGAHVEGYNAVSIGICMVGGVDKDNKPVNNFSKEQMASLKVLLKGLKEKHPKAVVQGHNEFPKVAKACPSFSVSTWLKANPL